VGFEASWNRKSADTKPVVTFSILVNKRDIISWLEILFGINDMVLVSAKQGESLYFKTPGNVLKPQMLQIVSAIAGVATLIKVPQNQRVGSSGLSALEQVSISSSRNL
jgi:hypothetical protein